MCGDLLTARLQALEAVMNEASGTVESPPEAVPQSFDCPRAMMIVCPLFFGTIVFSLVTLLRRTARIERDVRALSERASQGG